MNIKIKNVKNKANYLFSKSVRKVNAGLAAVSTAIGLNVAYATDNVDSTLSSTLNIIFGLMQFGGFLLTAYGVVIIARAIASPDSSDPHGMTKGVSAIIGGVLMLAMKSILKLIGVDVDTWTLSSQV